MRIERAGWDGRDPARLARELRAPGAGQAESIAPGVAATIDEVRSGGDEAVISFGERFDGVRVGALRVPGEALEAAPGAIDTGLREALERSAVNVRAVAEAQITPASEPAMADGHRITLTEVPVGSAAIYAPGGRSPYPSSVLMGVVPAVVAGVGRVVVASPPGPDGLPAAAVLAAARIAGAHEAYGMGGAQAIAALAHGTESVAAVDVIAGPGSPWVQEAKLQCSRVVGIDGYAGPSELMVICDRTADADWVALDLLAQAEHGDEAPLVCASPEASVLDAVSAAVERLAGERPSSFEARLTLVEAPDLDACLVLSQSFAPEHLELSCDRAAGLAELVTTAGCVFVGPHSAVAFGDYSAGSNHILPTGGAGRFTGPVGPGTFRRRISRVALDGASASALAPTVDTIARAEDFPVHGESARARAGEQASGPGEQAS